LILTVDLGTSATKVALWEEDGLVAIGRSRLETEHGPGGRVEQDPRTWWASVVEACAQARALAHASDSVDVEAIGFSAARQSFVPVDAGMRALGKALLWSDRRAGTEAAELAARFGGAGAFLRETGLVLGAGSVAAKVAWLARHDPGLLQGARWLLAPRDFVASHMTGVVATDITLASATGLYDAGGDLLEGLAPEVASLLPQPLDPSSVVGTLARGPAADLGVAPGAPVAIGAGDRPCEVLGAGATPQRPMVSWGTTANVSLPLEVRPDLPPPGTVLTRSANGGWLAEGGLSAAGSLLEWVGSLTGLEVPELELRGLSSPPGARGLLVMPWLGGARAPWWRDDAHACVLGVRPEHGASDIARAAVEGVAFDVARCLEVMSSLEAMSTAGGGFDGLALGGGGSTMPLWANVLSAVTGLPASCRRSGEAASAGAALIAALAVGAELDLERLDPVDSEVSPGPEEIGRYAELRQTSDQAATRVLGLSGITVSEPWTRSRGHQPGR
jgi:xylulokinase